MYKRIIFSQKVEGKSSEDQTKDRNLMKTIRAEIMLDLNKLKENLPLFQVYFKTKILKILSSRKGH